MKRWNHQQVACKMGVPPYDDMFAVIETQETKRLANRATSFAYQEVVDPVPRYRTSPLKNLEPWQSVGHPMKETRGFRSCQDSRNARQSFRPRQFLLMEQRMTARVSRASRPIDGHIVEQFVIMTDDRSLAAGHPASRNANDEGIRILPAQVGTRRIEKRMLLMRGFCRLPHIFARRRPLCVAQSRRSESAEMLEAGLGREPEVRWGIWTDTEKIPETAQHVMHASILSDLE
jgi:hypothetical protein